MKTAEINTRTIIGTNGSYSINKDKAFGSISFTDFFPGYKGEKEYERIIGALIEGFLADKFFVNKASDTVTVDFNTLFPCIKKIPRGMKTIELSRELYEQIMEHMKTSDKVLIRAQEYYPEKNYK